MTSKEMRANRLAETMDTSKFYSINVNNIPVGSTVKVVVDGKEMTLDELEKMSSKKVVTPFEEEERVNECKGNCKCTQGVSNVDHRILKVIDDNGFVYNTVTYRRWITAQTFRMLNWSGYHYDGKVSKFVKGWDAYLNHFLDYNYMWKMTLNEIKRIAKLERACDTVEFKKAILFFNRDVVADMIEHYCEKIRHYALNEAKFKEHRDFHYSYYSIKSKYKVYTLKEWGDVTREKLEEKIRTCHNYAKSIKNAYSYMDVYQLLEGFMKYKNKLPNDTQRCPEWRDAYKGAGAYYTLENIAMFHHINLVDNDTQAIKILKKATDKIDYLYNLAKKYGKKGEKWRLHQYMKMVIEVNDFDLASSIRKLNKEKLYK